MHKSDDDLDLGSSILKIVDYVVNDGLMNKYITPEVCPSFLNATYIFKIPVSLPRCRQPLIHICGFEQSRKLKKRNTTRIVEVKEKTNIIRSEGEDI